MCDSAVYRVYGLSHEPQLRLLTSLLTRMGLKKRMGKEGKKSKFCLISHLRASERAHSVCVREESGQVSVSLSSIHPACVFNEPHPPLWLSPFIRHLFHFNPPHPLYTHATYTHTRTTLEETTLSTECRRTGTSPLRESQICHPHQLHPDSSGCERTVRGRRCGGT